MKALILFILSIKTSCLIAQVKTDILVLGPEISIDKVKWREDKIAAYADSIKNYKGGELPIFLLNPSFDLQKFLWSGFHSPISLRWKVLEKINNKEALKKILVAHDKRLKQKCSYDKGSNPEIIVPMIEKSFCNLIRKRYRQLKKGN